MRVDVRPIASVEVDELAVMCREHAQYERAAEVRPDVARLREALFSPSPRLHAWVAAAQAGPLLGFASATIDYSTWHTRAFMHLDCLFVRESARGAGLGRRLLAEACNAARALGIDQLQWQTPDWNTSAQRFYARHGATAQTKVRFTLSLDAQW